METQSRKQGDQQQRVALEEKMAKVLTPRAWRLWMLAREGTLEWALSPLIEAWEIDADCAGRAYEIQVSRDKVVSYREVREDFDDLHRFWQLNRQFIADDNWVLDEIAEAEDGVRAVCALQLVDGREVYTHRYLMKDTVRYSEYREWMLSHKVRKGMLDFIAEHGRTLP